MSKTKKQRTHEFCVCGEQTYKAVCWLSMGKSYMNVPHPKHICWNYRAQWQTQSFDLYDATSANYKLTTWVAPSPCRPRPLLEHLPESGDSLSSHPQTGSGKLLPKRPSGRWSWRLKAPTRNPQNCQKCPLEGCWLRTTCHLKTVKQILQGWQNAS